MLSAAELRRDCEAFLASGAENPLAPLRTVVEVIAFVIYSLRMNGATEDEVVDGVTLLIVATDLSREEVRSVRDTFQKLRYSAAITQKLTALARRAKPAPDHAQGNPSAAEEIDLPRITPKVDETALALR